MASLRDDFYGSQTTDEDGDGRMDGRTDTDRDTRRCEHRQPQTLTYTVLFYFSYKILGENNDFSKRRSYPTEKQRLFEHEVDSSPWSSPIFATQ